MTVVIDIECPECGQSSPLQKVGIATYRCADCDTTFGRDEAEP